MYQLGNQCSWKFCSQRKQDSSNWFLCNGLEIYPKLITWNNSRPDGLDTQPKVVWPGLDSTTPYGYWHGFACMGCCTGSGWNTGILSLHLWWFYDNASGPCRDQEDRKNCGENWNTNKQKITSVQDSFDIVKISKEEKNFCFLLAWHSLWQSKWMKHIITMNKRHKNGLKNKRKTQRKDKETVSHG